MGDQVAHPNFQFHRIYNEAGPHRGIRELSISFAVWSPLAKVAWLVYILLACVHYGLVKNHLISKM